MSWWNPFSWLPEDPVQQCGWRFLKLVRDPLEDPYLEACKIDDKLTSKGSWGETHLSLERVIQNFLDEVTEIQQSYSPKSAEYHLGELYKLIYPKVVGMFWEGTKSK